MFIIDLLHYSIAISLTKPMSFQKKMTLKDFLRWTDIWAFFYAVTELPQARKASLARFLEKRKDRYNISVQHISKKIAFLLNFDVTCSNSGVFSFTKAY